MGLTTPQLKNKLVTKIHKKPWKKYTLNVITFQSKIKNFNKFIRLLNTPG
jgi:hypothetical protein